MPALATLTSLLIALNYWGWQEYYLGIALGLIWLLLTCWLIGGRMNQLATYRIERLAWGLIITTSIISLTASILFYFNLFNTIATFSLAALLPWLGTAKKLENEPKPTSSNSWTQFLTSSLIALLYLALALIIFLLLNSSATGEAIRTPWAVVPPVCFILIGLLAGLILFLARTKLSPIWLIPFYLIFLSLLINIYPLGYGFDPFIHQASEKLLATTGTISPKPFYYLGQYTLVNFWAQILNLSIKTIDTWLVPLLAALIIPITTFSFTQKITAAKPLLLLLPLAPLLFTLSDFTYTTPQGLAYLFVLITILAIATRRLGVNIPSRLLWLFGLAAVFTHPLAGLPLLGILIIWWLKEYGFNLKNKKLWRVLAISGTALIVPLSFAVMSWLAPSAASIKISADLWVNLRRLFNNIIYHLPFLPRFIDLPDSIYLWGRPVTLIFIILAFIGYWLARKNYKPLEFIGQVAILPFIGFLILSLFFTFPNLPPNEQDFYTIRLWDITLLLLWPLVILGLYWLAKKILPLFKHDTSWILAGSLVLVASFYLTYPRLDIWHRDTAYNTTTYDMAAVRLIEQEAQNSPYVVLANQAVAAAAVNEFGFSKYYQGHFYYPLPTGTNPLYQVYLNAAERGLPTRDIIAPAADLGISQVFLVLNRYWADYDTLSKVAKDEADTWWQIADGRITVYRYDF
ncbi:MAG: hypothetical protein UV52_C0007G0002 [Parcubacteria group bacterium GW2011_GWD1_42_9]|nr:MAG: hypothetical protein UV52_C0007G0002 [Parcubacteria group bacterium GW2011_GWD1_42_9]